jgi:hypothetical protein
MSDQIKTFDVLKIDAVPLHRTEKVPFHIPENETIAYPRSKSWSSDKIYDDIVRGHVPSQKLLKKSDKIMALGSCFANNLTKYLQSNGGRTTTYNLPSNLQNVFSIHDFFQWISTGWENGAYWNEPTGGIFTPEETYTAYKEDMNQCKAFIITLGLSEIWKDKLTDQVLWRAVPKHVFDDDRHKFEISTVDDTIKTIQKIVNIIRDIQPEGTVIFTLSPVPLSATFTGKSCVTADSVSKAILRVALDSYMRNKTDENVYYWPSYEMIKDIPQHRNETSYGEDIPDHRHVNDRCVKKVIEKFMSLYYMDFE